MGKYDRKVRKEIDIFWRDNHYPPTVRHLMAVCGVPSTSQVFRIMRGFKDVEIVRGHPIPQWIKDAIKFYAELKEF
jgi:hypothetical protein